MRAFVLFFALAAISSTCCQRVSGDLLIQMLQIGNDVVVTSEGTVDTTTSTLFFFDTFSFGGSVQPTDVIGASAHVITGVPVNSMTESPLVDIYFNENFGPVVGSLLFGSGTTVSAPDFGFGDVHGFFSNRFDPSIVVPAGYVSGAPLFSQMTYMNRSFVDLGVTEGTFNWSLEGNEITLVIIVPVDLPAFLGDVNQDGEVTFADIPSFIEVLLSDNFLDEADCNQDGVVDFADIPAFIEILLAG